MVVTPVWRKLNFRHPFLEDSEMRLVSGSSFSLYLHGIAILSDKQKSFAH